jgi:hypothetical protein
MLQTYKIVLCSEVRAMILQEIVKVRTVPLIKMQEGEKERFPVKYNSGSQGEWQIQEILIKFMYFHVG